MNEGDLPWSTKEVSLEITDEVTMEWQGSVNMKSYIMLLLAYYSLLTLWFRCDVRSPLNPMHVQMAQSVRHGVSRGSRTGFFKEALTSGGSWVCLLMIRRNSSSSN